LVVPGPLFIGRRRGCCSPAVTIPTVIPATTTGGSSSSSMVDVHPLLNLKQLNLCWEKKKEKRKWSNLGESGRSDRYKHIHHVKMNTGTRALGNNLKLQKRLAMSILNCGRSKAWLDPDRKELIAKARTRTDLPPPQA
jgi:hypothetical protein